jgi:hydrogenase maturation factor
MCQIPVGKVVKIDGKGITVEFKGKTRLLNPKLVKVKVGDYVSFSTNIAIEKVDKDSSPFTGFE